MLPAALVSEAKHKFVMFDKVRASKQFYNFVFTIKSSVAWLFKIRTVNVQSC